MARVTFSGPAVQRMRTCAADQRIKIFFPNAAGRLPAIDDGPDWYAAYKLEDPRVRPPMRTYTIRRLRAERNEVDVDFVLHGDGGPASRWALSAKAGDGLQMLAPDVDFNADPSGYEWRPPQDLTEVLLIADETALPALAGILEALAARSEPPATQAFVEIPEADDALPTAIWPSLSLAWMPRGASAHGSRMIEALSLALIPAGATAAALDGAGEIDIEAALPWERATQSAGGFYAWVAGESGAVMAIRRELIQLRRLDRRAVNLMGYWREGRAID
jgi:NADPH-dependent ferric siderophore reductase